MIKKHFKLLLLLVLVGVLSAQASGGIVEFWAPGPDLVVKNFEVVDLGFYTVPNLTCTQLGKSGLTFVYGLADTVQVEIEVGDTTKKCLTFVNVNPVTDEMFQAF